MTTPRRTGTSTTLIGLVLALALLAFGAAACGGDDAVSTGPATSATTTASGTTGSGGAPTGDELVLDVALLRDGKLAIAHRAVPRTEAVGRAALEQLVSGPSAADAGLATAVPAGTTIGSLAIADGVATVELTPAVTDPTAQAQVVFTMTQFPTVGKVRLGAGAPALGRDDVTAALPQILVESVAPGDVVSSPVKISGLNNTFENNVRLRILGADGRVLADTFATGTGEPGTWGPFAESVTFAPGSDTRGTVVAFTTSGETGATIGVVEIPVRFGT